MQVIRVFIKTRKEAERKAALRKLQALCKQGQEVLHTETPTNADRIFIVMRDQKHRVLRRVDMNR